MIFDGEKEDVLGEDEESFIEDLGLGAESEENKGDESKEKEEEESGEKKGDEEEGKEDEKSDDEQAEEDATLLETPNDKLDEKQLARKDVLVKAQKEEEEGEQKDLTKEEVNKLPKDSQGLYYAHKKMKARAQKAEAELQYLKIHNKYSKKEEKPTKEEEKPPERDFESVEDILKDKPDDDLISVGEQKRIDIATKKEVAYQSKIVETKGTKISKEQQTAISRMDDLEDAFKADHPDYDQVYSVFLQAMADIPALRVEILAEAQREDGDPAKKAYELGQKFKGVYTAKKGTTESGKPTKSSKEIKKMIKNADKSNPSGGVSGGGVSNDALGEMDDDELGKTLNAMSFGEFSKVPRKIRDRVT